MFLRLIIGCYHAPFGTPLRLSISINRLFFSLSCQILFSFEINQWLHFIMFFSISDWEAQGNHDIICDGCASKYCCWQCQIFASTAKDGWTRHSNHFAHQHFVFIILTFVFETIHVHFRWQFSTRWIFWAQWKRIVTARFHHSSSPRFAVLLFCFHSLFSVFYLSWLITNHLPWFGSFNRRVRWALAN